MLNKQHKMNKKSTKPCLADFYVTKLTLNFLYCNTKSNAICVQKQTREDDFILNYTFDLLYDMHVLELDCFYW